MAVQKAEKSLVLCKPCSAVTTHLYYSPCVQHKSKTVPYQPVKEVLSVKKINPMPANTITPRDRELFTHLFITSSFDIIVISSDSLCWVILLTIFLCDRTVVFWNSYSVQTPASSQDSLLPWYQGETVCVSNSNWGKKRIVHFSVMHSNHSISPFHNTLLLAIIHICNAECVLLHIKSNSSSFFPDHNLCNYIVDFIVVLIIGLCSQPTTSF